MKNRFTRITTCLLFFLMLSLTAFSQQETEYVMGEVLVQIGPDTDIDNVVATTQQINGITTGMEVKKHVSRHMRVWLLGFDHQKVDHKTVLNSLNSNRYVTIAQNNHIIRQRLVPNDTQYGNQWQYDNNGSSGGVVDADIDAPEAWNITTGGLTALGDTIVACVIDDGLDLSHQDFGDNLWVNYAEIPNDNIDNDGNGYVDDYQGWDADGNDDDISGGGHGSPVAGIVGAKGNNGIGVAGVNWDVKLMIVKGGGNEAQAVAAYSYPLEMRKMYNQSNGTQGAFVVSTNASWGINGGQPANAPLWCAMYDTLGVYGILSAGATANTNSNIDIVGDLPTACPSEYLISVTNCDRTDNKVTFAGYGATTIDIGAHGQDTWTVAAGNGYGGFGGTSGATPHVCGAIALLYSSPCVSFAVLAKSMPDSAARLARDYIFNGGDPNSSLAGITTTGNRLNLKGSLDLLMNDCDTSVCAAPFALDAANIDTASADLSWLAIPGVNGFTIEYREVGAPSWTSTTQAGSTLNLTGLMACTDYEYRVSADCGANGTSNFSLVYTFRTDGCCDAPVGLAMSNVANTTADVQWNTVTAAVTYDIRYRPTSGGAWTDVTGISGTSTNITGLMECTEYEIQVMTMCDTSSTGFTPSEIFTTLGCGACEDLTYCAASGGSAEEWIEEFTIGSMTNTSGNDGGYGDYTGNPTTLYTGWSYNLVMTPAFAGQQYDEWFMVWIDYNQDGDFDDANENVYDSGVASNSQVNGTFVVPASPTLGVTRLRVAMQYDAPVGNCEDGFQYGEVEDYCVELRDTSVGIYDLNNQLAVSLFPNPASSQLTVIANGATSPLQLELVDATGRVIHSEQMQGNQSILNTTDISNGVYFIRLSDGEAVVHTSRAVIRH